MIIEDKITPHDLRTEQAVLGACLFDQDGQDAVLPHLHRGLFCNTQNELISGAIQKLRDSQKKVDSLTVVNELKRGNVLEDAGGAYYIAQLTNGIASSANVVNHIFILKELYIRRTLIDASRTIRSRSEDNSMDIFDTISGLKNSLDEIDKVIVKHQRAKDLSTIADESVSQLKSRIKNYNEGKITGIPSWPDLDRQTGGWQKGDLIILSARPGMGKTAVVLDFAKRAAINGHAPLIFSLEMSDTRLMDRLIIGESDIYASKYRNGEMTNIDLDNATNAANRIKQMPITIIDNPGLSFRDMRSHARIKAKEGKCDLIIIDYLQLCTPDVSNRNREQEVADMSRKAKLMAKELSVPVILLTQLSRETEKQGDKKPKLSHLRESGAIEQDADMVLFIYRPSYYGLTDESGGDISDFGEIIIAKHRNGSLVDVPFKHNESLTKFFPFQQY